MLARPLIATVRTRHAGIAKYLYAHRPFRTTAAKAFHIATGDFTNVGPDGTPATKKVSIRVGGPGEAYVLIPTEIGYALQAASCLTANPSGLPNHQDRLALTFYHDTQHFASDSSPGCPRLTIPQQLPRQSTANTSPATLYLYGVMHTIALNGTPDAAFAELASTILPERGKALEKLKDM